MRRLGERPSYSAHGPSLGRSVHSDFHARQVLLIPDGETTTELDGLGSSWCVQLGRYQERPALYPRDRQLDAMDRRDKVCQEVARVMAAVARLPEWEPHGELLHDCLMAVCIRDPVRLSLERGWRHGGEGFEAWRRRLGDKAAIWRLLERAWGIVAALVVDSDVVRAAQVAGAVDERAVAWARERAAT